MCNKYQHARLRPLSLSALNRLILRPIYNTCRRPESEILMMKSQMTNFVLDHYKRELLVRAVIWNEDEMKGVLKASTICLLVIIMDHAWRSNLQEQGKGKQALIVLFGWTLLTVAYLSFFVCVCPDNLRPRFRSQQLNLSPPPPPPTNKTKTSPLHI